MNDQARALNRLKNLRDTQATRIRYFKAGVANASDLTTQWQETHAIAVEQARIDGFAEALAYLDIDPTDHTSAKHNPATCEVCKAGNVRPPPKKQG
jgi:hypothetical protein